MVRILLLLKRRLAKRIVLESHRDQQHLQTLLPRDKNVRHMAVLRSL